VRTSSRLASLAGSDVEAELPRVPIPLAELEAADLAGLFFLAGLCASRGEARRLIRQGGAYLDNRALGADDEKTPLSGAAWLKAGGQAVLRAGKKRYMIVKVS
jgi:tyrosyl-tRNA synthetase